MATCMRCNAALSFFENVSHLGRTKFCSRCEVQIRDTLRHLQQQMMQASAQNMVTEQFCGYVQQILTKYRIPPDRTTELLHRLGYLKKLSDIRQGHLPNVRVSAILDTDEMAHLETIATYYKPNKQVKFIQGKIIATNKKLYFITPDRNSMTIDWNTVVNVDESQGTTPTGQYTVLMHIQVAKGSGGGFYYVPDPTLAVAIISTAVRIWKRHLVEL